MKILITGISGLMGCALKGYFEDQGHEVIGFSLRNLDNLEALKSFPPQDVIINLCGETIGQRWSKSAKKRIYESRIHTTRLLVQKVIELKNLPKVFINASSSGGYEKSNAPATEYAHLTLNNEFLKRVIIDWEAATLPLDPLGIRRINLRFGHILSKRGGLLGKILPIFKLGLGGYQGSGEQLISWIDIDDAARAIDFCIHNTNIQGPVNLVAPEVVTNKCFYKMLGKKIHYPVAFRLPSWFLKLIFGREFAQEIMLNDYNASPKKLLDAGFNFKYPTLQQSFDHLLK